MGAWYFFPRFVKTNFFSARHSSLWKKEPDTEVVFVDTWPGADTLALMWIGMEQLMGLCVDCGDGSLLTFFSLEKKSTCSCD